MAGHNRRALAIQKLENGGMARAAAEVGGLSANGSKGTDLGQRVRRLGERKPLKTPKTLWQLFAVFLLNFFYF